MSKSIVELLKDESYKQKLIDSLSGGISEDFLPAFNELINYVIDKFDIFQIPEFEKSFYYDDDETLELILPAIRRVFAKLFIDPPSIFRGSTESQRHQLFILYFNIDEFMNYLIEMMIKCKESLIHFEHIDRTAETLTLIVDNYVAGLVKKVRDCDDIETEVQRIKKELQRENSLKEILGND